MRWVDGLDQMLTLGSIGSEPPDMRVDKRVNASHPLNAYHYMAPIMIHGRLIATDKAVPTWANGEKIEEA